MLPSICAGAVMQKMDQRSDKREDMRGYTRVHVTRSIEFSSNIGCVEDLRGSLINKANSVGPTPHPVHAHYES